MKLRTKLLAGAIGATVVGAMAVAYAADVKEVQMLHWWTSGGEAAMTALKAMVAAGNPPTASQILGYFAVDYAEAGKLGDISSLAQKENWAEVVPKALQKFTTTNGKW